MADVREQITHHLTPHGVPMEIGIRRTDVAEMLSSMDWAMVLGMIAPRDAAMLMAVYMDDAGELRKLRSWWLMECVEHAVASQWKRPRPRMVEGLARATLEEHLGLGTRCSVCNGTRERTIDHRKVLCPGCHGAGFLPLSENYLIAAIGCEATEYARVWAERVGWARRALHRWEANAVEELRRRVGE